MSYYSEEIKAIWQKQHIIPVTLFANLDKLFLSQELKLFLRDIGLPLIKPEDGQSFLPFTFLHLINAQDKKFYLLGDVSLNFVGTSFLGLEKDNESIYRIWLNNDNEFTYTFANQSLYQFLLCLSHYNAFEQKYDGSSEVVGEEIRKDYQKLQEGFRRIDLQAMSQRDYFWKHRIEVMEVGGYGDYLTGREFPTMENPPTFTQDEIDNMDLPF